MWLSENRRRNETDGTETSVQPASGATTDVLRPANILRLPNADEDQLVMRCSDGTTVLLGVVGGDIPDGLEDGEIYIETEQAKITVKNNGAVNIEGSVSITGSLTVNGVSV